LPRPRPSLPTRRSSDLLGPAQGSQPYPFTSITGHASATGPEAQNSILSQQRAATVLTYLHSLLSDQCADFANVNPQLAGNVEALDRKSTRLNSSHVKIS